MLSNRFIFACLISGLFATVAIFSGPVQAGEQRHHEAHEHGVANLNVAVEGNNIYIEFSSPAANIVGFEHHPRTPEQKNAVKEAINKLRAGDALFILSAESKSLLVKSDVDTDIIKDADHHSESGHAHEGKDADHHSESERAHEEKDADHHSESERAHADKGHHDEAEHRHKEHGDADEHERHSEFKAQYHFTCKNPDRLSKIDVMLFRTFAGIEHIEVQLLNGTKQTAMELTTKKNGISL